MIKIGNIFTGTNFTPKRRAIVVNKWVREELKMPHSSHDELVHELVKMKWHTNNQANYEKEVSLLEKVFGRKVIDNAIADNHVTYYNLRNSIVKTLITGKFNKL